MPKQEPKEKTMVVLSIGHAHTLAQVASETQNYIDLQAIAEAVLTSANIFGSAAEYHNLAAEYARTDDYYSAYRIVEKGITQQYRYDIDLLADAIHYGSYCNKYSDCEKYKKELKARPRGAWNWRAFTFLVDYLNEKVGTAEVQDIMPMLDEALEISQEYQRVLRTEEKAYIAECEVRLLRERYIRESQNPDSANLADNEYRLAKEALKKAIFGLDDGETDKSIVAVQCALKYADMLFEERKYQEVISVCAQALEYVETQPSARVAYFKYISALSKDALVRQDNAFADYKRIEDVLNEFSVAYQVINEPTYEKNIKTRATFLAAEAGIPLPKVFEESSPSLNGFLSRLMES